MRAFHPLLVAIGIWASIAEAEQTVQAEAAPAKLAEAPWSEADAPGSPVRAPIPAWQAALGSLPQGVLIRRIAFASHGMFVFYSPSEGEEIWASFVRRQGDGYFAEEAELRDPGLCQAPGVAANRIFPALERLLLDPTWATHQAQLDVLVLECHGSELEWTLMPVPDGGVQAGVAIATFSVPFIDTD